MTAVRAEPRLQRRERRELGVERRGERRRGGDACPALRRRRLPAAAFPARGPRARSGRRASRRARRRRTSRRVRASVMPNARSGDRRAALWTPNQSPVSRRSVNVPVHRRRRGDRPVAAELSVDANGSARPPSFASDADRNAGERASRRDAAVVDRELADVRVTVGDRDARVAETQLAGRERRASPAPRARTARRRDWRASRCAPSQRSVAGAVESPPGARPPANAARRRSRRRSPRACPRAARAFRSTLALARASVTAAHAKLRRGDGERQLARVERHDGARRRRPARSSP